MKPSESFKKIFLESLIESLTGSLKKIEDRVSIISISGNWSQELSEITKDIKNETQQLLKESLPDRFERNVDRGVRGVILRYLENEKPF
ncbi:MAG: hypothetical protein MZV65_46405 [Chromatiales bacterium]|nr:hypothetical protein [Chromatiales bacterium]MCK7582305.1 hypothetical protein [Chromatiales bacterium]